MSWEKKFKETYYHKETFKHDSPKRISLFPYTTSQIKTEISNEMQSFFAISGEALKDLAMIETDVDCTSAAIISNVKDKVETQNHSDLEHIIRKTLFNENDQIHCFHPVIFYQLSNKKKQANILSMAHFARDILFQNKTSLGPDVLVLRCAPRSLPRCKFRVMEGA